MTTAHAINAVTKIAAAMDKPMIVACGIELLAAVAVGEDVEDGKSREVEAEMGVLSGIMFEMSFLSISFVEVDD